MYLCLFVCKYEFMHTASTEWRICGRGWLFGNVGRVLVMVDTCLAEDVSLVALSLPCVGVHSLARASAAIGIG